MIPLAKIVFWASFLLALHPYVIYPVLVRLAWSIRRRKPRGLTPHARAEPQAPAEPPITIIVPAHNEERGIARRIENLLALDYPRHKTQILIVSDASTDGTNGVVAAFAERGLVEFVALPERRGKTGAQNAALPRARGDVVVFTDASTLFRPDALRRILLPLADSAVGCVGGWVVLTTTGDFAGRPRLGPYLRFEQRLRQMEGEIWTTTGLNGCCYAIRRELLAPMDERAQIDDLVNGLRTIAAGRRVVYERTAVCAEAIEIESRAGFRRRVRTSLGGLTTLFSMPKLLNPLRRPFVAFQIFSHRLLRVVLVPLLLVSLLANLALARTSPLYDLILAAQLLFWLGVAAGSLIPRPPRALHPWLTRLARPCGVLYAFLQQHLASTLALWLYLTGSARARPTQWEPFPRQ